MKKMLLTLVAGLFVMAFAAVTHAGQATEMSAIDSSGLAVVSVSSPSTIVTAAQEDRVYLDSNGLWAAAPIVNVPSNATIAKKETADKMLLCFDSGSRFCARSY